MRVVCVNKERETVYIAHSCVCVCGERERATVYITYFGGLVFGTAPDEALQVRVWGVCVCGEREKESD